MQVLVHARHELLHQRQAQPLRDAAVDLALDQRRVDGPADIVRGPDLAAPSPCPAPGRPRPTPSAPRSRSWRRGCPARPRPAAGRRVPLAAPAQHVAGPLGSSRRRSTSRRSSPSLTRTRAVQRQPRALAGVGEAQDLPPQILAGQPRGVAGDERLPRGRGLAGVERQVGVAQHLPEAPTGSPSASAQIWTMMVALPCPMSTAPL